MEIYIGNNKVIVKGEEKGEECEICPQKDKCDKKWTDENGKIRDCIIPCG